jgi:hypothetical protein
MCLFHHFYIAAVLVELSGSEVLHCFHLEISKLYERYTCSGWRLKVTRKADGNVIQN